MDWSSFFGAVVGALIGILMFGGIIVGWDEIARRREAKNSISNLTVDDILEKQIEDHIVENFSILFPGWSIYSTQDKVEGNNERAGVYFYTEAGQIDILSSDDNGDLVVIELKRNKAPDSVIAQVDRYIAWVENNLAEAGQRVRGLIIANSTDKRLAYTLSRRDDIDFWAYSWLISFDKRIIQKTLQKDVSDKVKNPGNESE